MTDYLNIAKEYKFQYRTEITPKQNEIVDKVCTLTEEINKHPNLVNNKNAYVKAARGLEFSEKAIEGIELADDITTPLIGNWTFGTLNMLIQEVGSSVEKESILTMAMPEKPVPFYKIFLDRMGATTGILPEFDGNNSPIPTIAPLNSYSLVYQPGLWMGRTMFTSKDIAFARKRGDITFSERGIGQLIAYNTVNVVTQAYTRKKKLIADAIFNNGFTYQGRTVSSNIPAGNYISMYQPIGTLNADGSVTYANTDPLYSPLIAITNILSNPAFLRFRHYIKAIVVNAADLSFILNHPSVKAITNLLNAGAFAFNRKISLDINGISKELMGYFAPGFQFPLVADDQVWVGENSDGTNNNTSNFFVPRGKMFVLLDLAPLGGQMGAFHMTYNEVDPNVEAPAMGLFTGAFARNLHNSDVTVNRIDVVASLSGGPAVYMPEAFFIIDGLYSNA